MRNHKLLLEISKYTLYTVIFLVLFALQTTPGLFEVMGVRPNLLIPAAVAVAMHESEVPSGVLGLFAGLLCDLSASSFFGLYSLVLLVLCTGVSLLITHWLHCTYRTAVIVGFLMLFFCAVIRFYFEYGLWGYNEISKIFTGQTLPGVIYSLLTVPVMFFIFRRLDRYYKRKDEI